MLPPSAIFPRDWSYLCFIVNSQRAPPYEPTQDTNLTHESEIALFASDYFTQMRGRSAYAEDKLAMSNVKSHTFVKKKKKMQCSMKGSMHEGLPCLNKD